MPLPRPTILSLSGYGFSGKDTVCSILREFNPNVTRVAFADALKVEAFAAGWSGRKDTSEERQFIQDYGMKRRERDPLCWVRCLLDTMERLQCENPAAVFVVTDTRFHNEFCNLQHRGAVFWRIVRSINGTAITAANSHRSETEHLRWAADSTLIENYGTENDLRLRIFHHLATDPRLVHLLK